MGAFDDPRRLQAENTAFQAERAISSGDIDAARNLFAYAATLEEEVAHQVPYSKPRTRTTLAVSAVALWLKADRYADVIRAGGHFLSQPQGLTDSGGEELRRLMERAWRSKDIASAVGHSEDTVSVRLKLADGRVRHGLAPAGAARQKQRLLAGLVLRAAEYNEGHPYRTQGTPGADLMEPVEVLEAPAEAASYGLHLVVFSRSTSFFGTGDTARKALDTLLMWCRVASQEHETSRDSRELPLLNGPTRDSEEIALFDGFEQSHDYAAPILRQVANLAADGEQVGHILLEVNSPGGRRSQVALDSDIRSFVSDRISEINAHSHEDELLVRLVGLVFRKKIPYIRVELLEATPAHRAGHRMDVRIDRRKLKSFDTDWQETLKSYLRKNVRIHVSYMPGSRGRDLPYLAAYAPPTLHAG